MKKEIIINGKKVQLNANASKELIEKIMISYLPNVVHYKYHISKEESFILVVHMANNFAKKYGQPNFNKLVSEDKEVWYDILQGFYPLKEYDYNLLIFG